MACTMYTTQSIFVYIYTYVYLSLITLLHVYMYICTCTCNCILFQMYLYMYIWWMGKSHKMLLLLSYICCMWQEVKLCSPDYKDTEVDTAIKDFQERIKNYELAYEPLDTKRDKYEQTTRSTCTCTCASVCWLSCTCRELSWVKIHNVDDRYEANRIDGTHT